ncbi:MAG: hypothetical protein HY286_11825 [Planctomycetes bacterium]|nr:hypothetical protein [Planctomycetota bacterium]
MDRPRDWTRLCESSIARGSRPEAVMAFKNADAADHPRLRNALEDRFGAEILRELPKLPFAGLKTPWRDMWEFPWRGGAGFSFVAGTLFFFVTAKLLGPVGIALGSAALLFHHTTILRASLNGNEEPPYPADFPAFTFGVLVLPTAIIVAFAPMLFAFAMAFGVSPVQAGGALLTISAWAPFFALAGLALAAPAVLIAIAWEYYHSIDAFRPSIFAAPLVKRPLDAGVVILFYLLANAAACALLASSIKTNILLFVPYVATAQLLLSFSARRAALFARVSGVFPRFETC